jgi:hypothetical protein
MKKNSKGTELQRLQFSQHVTNNLFPGLEGVT